MAESASISLGIEVVIVLNLIGPGIRVAFPRLLIIAGFLIGQAVLDLIFLAEDGCLLPGGFPRNVPARQRAA